jgi:ATP-dependent 26S proteasome regulatory subunit
MVDFSQLAQDSDGMSGAEISLVCREAGLMALTEDQNIEKAGMDEIFVKHTHLMKSLQDVKMRGKKS